MSIVHVPQAERRKQVRLRHRPDLSATAQRYEGRICHVVKDPVGLKYYRLNEHEYFVFKMLDGRHTLEDIQKAFEEHYRPERLTLEDLEAFARQLVTSGLVLHESPHAASQLFTVRNKQKRMKRLATITNILYMKIPIIDPDRLLTWMVGKFSFIFTRTFLILSVIYMLSAVALVTMKFNVFWAKLPAYQEFFRFQTMLYMWISLGFVKVIHEFGHGLSCKEFGGECHEMGFLFMCFSPALYCNVTDSWTLASKWRRILISFAGIYVELIIAATATFIWWYTPHWPFVNNMALALMTLCSVSTFVFNANPLMRFDGYYMLADWLEVPNLRERANRYLSNLFQQHALGIEVYPEAYMAPWRRFLFLVYAIGSYLYRWVVTVSILFFLAKWLKPYKLESISFLLAIGSLASLVGWPIYRMLRGLKQRGRLPDMKRTRVIITVSFFLALILAFILVPLPVTRVREHALVEVQENDIVHVYVHSPGGRLVKQYVKDGDEVQAGQVLADFDNIELDRQIKELESKIADLEQRGNQLRNYLRDVPKDQKSDVEKQLSEAQGSKAGFKGELEQKREARKELVHLTAPRAGIAMGTPTRDEMFKGWDPRESGPFCSIGDTMKIRIRIPATPAQYREMKENLDRQRAEHPDRQPSLEVSVLLANRSDHIYKGRVTTLPDTNEKNVPVGLTSRGGGPLGVKPNQDPKVHEPIAQTYLITAELMDPDGTIVPETMAEAKIHLRWRSAAWWVGQKIASALDITLW